MQGFSLLVEGNYCEIIGRVCMDQLMIRLPYQMPVGTKVTLIGEANQQAKNHNARCSKINWVRSITKSHVC